MKPASPALITYINNIRNTDQPLMMADCFTFSLQNGSSLYYTNLDQPVTLDGNVFLANSVLVDGLKYKAGIGLDVDKQDITISASSTDLVGDVPFLQALSEGAFDGCELLRERVFFSSFNPLTQIGSVVLFQGRMSEVTSIGRLSAKVSVSSDLVLLDIDMPRNLFSTTCIWTLYGAGCSLNRASFASVGLAGSGSTFSTINWVGAIAGHAQGRFIWDSGANEGVSGTVKSVVPGVSLTLIYPLYNLPNLGDSFTVYQGCAHTTASCQFQFNNLANFRGYPFVPPPQQSF